MTPSPRTHHAPAVDRGRSTLIRRSAAVLAGLLVLGTPLVAQALDDDAAADAASPAPAADEATYASTRVPSLTERPDPETMRPAVRLKTAEVDVDPAVAERALLMAAYTWDEQSPQVSELEELLGVVAVDGRYDSMTRRAHLRVLAYSDLPTTGVPAAPLPPGPSAEQWAALRECEANGNYAIVSSNGTYRGAYQFNRSTWDSVASRHDPLLVGVDPAAAIPADQDAMAFALYSERGAQPWPHCGRHLS